MRSCRLILCLFGCLIFWGAGAAFHARGPAAAELNARHEISEIVASGPILAKAIAASGAAQFEEQLKPVDKLCDVPCWDAVLDSKRGEYSPAASPVALTTGRAAPQLVGVVVLLI